MSYYSDVDIPRAEMDNPEGLSKIELEERERAIKQMQKEHPTVSPVHIQYCWNYIRRQGLEKVREQINSGEFDKPGQYAVPTQD
jgi:hypothetical protein